MTRLPFRIHHLFELLAQWEEEPLPLDAAMNRYFRAHKAIGSKDKKYIAETAYELVRQKRLLWALGAKNWPEALELLCQREQLADATKQLQLAEQFSCPDDLFLLLQENFGTEQACTLCEINNQRAPTTVRVNPLVCQREDLLERWTPAFDVTPCKQSKLGIHFLTRINFFGLPEFKEGCFEVQDEGSQLLANLVKAAPGDQVMDYCAGAGGKTLAFAHRLEGKGQIYLHDIRTHALQEAKKRLKRAQVQNVQIVPQGHPRLKKLKGKMDWVLADVPCSGTGTLRRNPDMKWRFSSDGLGELRSMQRVIFERALSFSKPKGYIVYATCSILKEENQEQVAHFLKTYPIELLEEFQSLPSPNGMDGFYGAVFRRVGH